MKLTKTEILDYDVVDHLDSDEMIEAYLNAALEENDIDLFIHCLGNVIRAIGMTEIAKRTGLNRESLYKVVRPGAKPRHEAIVKIINSLGLNFKLSNAA